MDTQGELRTKAKAAYVLAGVCAAAAPYLAVAKLPPTQHGGKSNGFLTTLAVGLAILSLVIGLVDRRMARSAPVERPEVSAERRAAAQRELRLLMGGQAILMTGVGGALLLGHHVPMALLSFLAAAIFVTVPALAPKRSKDAVAGR
jgi:hypothetical protein